MLTFNIGLRTSDLYGSDPSRCMHVKTAPGYLCVAGAPGGTVAGGADSDTQMADSIAEDDAAAQNAPIVMQARPRPRRG